MVLSPERRLLMRRFCCFLLLAVLLFSTCSCLAEDEVIPPQWPVPDYVAHLLEAASDEVGYTEEEHGRTKYGEWVGDPYCQWCAEFLCWCVDQVDKSFGTNLLNQVYPLYSGSNEGRAWFITAGRYVNRKGPIEDWGYEWLKGADSFIASGDYIPQPGDWVFFTWTSDADTDHVAMRILGYGTVHDAADITMHFGNKGEKVRQLQEKLAYLGLLDPQYVNGAFGNATNEALRTFQLEYDLRPLGWANMLTQKKLDDACQEKYENTPDNWIVESEGD